MGDRNRGLYHKFFVERTGGQSAVGQKHEGCDYFVLDLEHDPHAVAAVVAYANSCGKDGYYDLAKDLLDKLRVSGAEDIRIENILQRIEQARATPTNDAAVRDAAEEIERYCAARPTTANRQEIVRSHIAAIITKHLAARTGDSKVRAQIPHTPHSDDA